MEVKSEFLRCFSNLVYSYVNVWGLVDVKELLDLQFASGLLLERRFKEEGRWFCVPVSLFSEMVLFLWMRRGKKWKELMVLFLRMGQASGSSRRVSGGKESGKVPVSVTWKFFFPWTGRRRWFSSWRREPEGSWCKKRWY